MFCPSRVQVHLLLLPDDGFGFLLSSSSSGLDSSSSNSRGDTIRSVEFVGVGARKRDLDKVKYIEWYAEPQIEGYVADGWATETIMWMVVEWLAAWLLTIIHRGLRRGPDKLEGRDRELN